VLDTLSKLSDVSCMNIIVPKSLQSLRATPETLITRQEIRSFGLYSKDAPKQGQLMITSLYAVLRFTDTGTVS